MAPKSTAYRHLQQRMRRTLSYGTRRMQTLSLPLSELAVDYFDKYAPFDYMKMDFATSLAREGCVDACTFLVAMVYVDRMRNADKAHFEASDPGEIYLSALVVASKYLHDGGLDEYVYNDEWAASASTSLKRVNLLELQLLETLSWNINVGDDEFVKVLNEAEYWVAKEFTSKLGFCTYNELAVLSTRIDFFENVLKPLFSLLASAFILYSAFAFSLLLSPRISISSVANTDASLPQNVLGEHWSQLQFSFDSLLPDAKIFRRRLSDPINRILHIFSPKSRSLNHHLDPLYPLLIKNLLDKANRTSFLEMGADRMPACYFA